VLDYRTKPAICQVNSTNFGIKIPKSQRITRL
jgi:hypothetical protein